MSARVFDVIDENSEVYKRRLGDLVRLYPEGEEKF